MLAFSRVRAPLAAALCITGCGGAAVGQTQLAPTTPAHTGNFGGYVAGVPDIDGDGFGDVAVGAPGETVSGVTGAGRVYVYSGRFGVLVRTLISPTPVLNGAFGASVAGVPDTDGDGRGDIAVGAPDENGGSIFSSGKVYLFSGATGVLLRTYISPGRITGGGFGSSVAGVFDATGDGRGDIVVGAPFEHGPGAPASSGRAYIFSGRSGGLWQVLATPWPQANGQFGYAVAGLRDANGDGFGDVVVGAPRESPNGSPVNSGRVHLFNGHTGARIVSQQSPGIAAQGFFGLSVAGLDDTNGDGRSDFVVGAPDEHPGTSPDKTGRAYIYSGANGHFLKTLYPPNPVANLEFGISVGGVPDTNQDGVGDVIVGAWMSQATGGAGRAFLYSGTGSGLYATRLLDLQSPNMATGGLYGVMVAGIPGNAGGTTRGDFVVGASDEAANGAPTQSGRAYIYRR